MASWRFISRFVVAALIALSSAPAAAQPRAPAEVKPVLVPPRPITPIHADYPADGKGDAFVVLALVVNADGSVRSARVLEGAEPFAAAALLAYPAWRFDPATSDGAPIAATIRAEVRFTAPPPEPAPPAPPPAFATAAPPGSPSAPPPSPSPEPIEVTVRGEQPAPGVTSLSRAEVRLLPGAFGDPFRAVEMLPGVTPLASGVPYFYVRGAPPGNVGYFLDGIRVPLLYHIGLGPSVIHPALIDHVDLYPGGYPARFGRYAGGIVSGETTPPLPEWHGEANLRIVDAGAMLEGPINGDRGTFFVAGRYSYTAPLLKLIQSDLSLAYGDYQARVTYRLTPRDEIGVFAFGAYDYLGQSDNGTSRVLFDTTFHRVDLRYDHSLGGPDDRIRQAITVGYDQTGFDKGAFVRDRLLGSRTELTHRLSDRVLLRAGLDAQVDVYEEGDLDKAITNAPGFTSLFASRPDIVVGARADAVIEVTPRLEVTPGLRVDLFGSQGTTALGVDPRLAARLALTRAARLLEAFGLASQTPSFILPGPGFQQGLTGGLQRSLQMSAGVEVDLPADVTASATFFRDAFFDMTDALGTSPLPGNGSSFPSNFGRRTLGSSVGLELTARRRLTRRLGGFLSYTLSRSVRSLGGSTFASAFDRTHVLNVAAVYDFGRGYKAGARVVFYTGAPISNVVRMVPYTIEQTGRLPPFFRLDLRFEKRWTIGERWWISAVVEVLNATLSKETVDESCATCAPVTIGPVTVPSIGVEAGF